MRRVLESGLFVLALSVAAAQAPNDGLAQANSALQAGEADKALSLISSLPVSAESRNLRCRVLFTIEHWDEAVYECEQAVRLDGQSSTNHMWYGRALGEKADRATFLTAYSLAKRVKAEFEEATRLNPRNAEALADLSEFYISAPGVVGGGIDKAESVAAQMEKLDAARGHELRGAIAQSRKDYGTAEREFKQAVAVSERPSFQWMRLGSFYRKRERWDDMLVAWNDGTSVHLSRSSALAHFCRFHAVDSCRNCAAHRVLRQLSNCPLMGGSHVCVAGNCIWKCHRRVAFPVLAARADFVPALVRDCAHHHRRRLCSTRAFAD